MRIALFDWTSGGHHPLYVRRFVEALRPAAELVVAAPDEMLAQIADLDVESIPLGVPRPLVDLDRPLAPQHRELAERELDLFREIAARSRADHLVHLYADPVIRRLVRRPPFPLPLTLCVFFARAHYPTSYDSPLAPRELLRAWFHEYLVRRWQGRRDAHALFTLDEEAARRWSRRGGARAFWLPEPPILSIPVPAEGRSGCLLYGTLAPRKGLDLVARAVSLAPTSLRVVLAGEVEPGFRDSLERDAAAMREAGADIDLRLHRHNEEEGLRLIGGARCVLLPYLNHYTASRVLLEAATAGTPVVAHHRGLLGHLVREHELGLTVDCTDPGALRQAMLELAKPASAERYLEPLRRFAARYASERFRDAVSIPFAVEGSPRQARVRAQAAPLEGARMTERKRTA
jgi:glycosyltransferase involved in cell wall biosynthesis